MPNVGNGANYEWLSVILATPQLATMMRPHGNPFLQAFDAEELQGR